MRLKSREGSKCMAFDFEILGKNLEDEFKDLENVADEEEDENLEVSEDDNEEVVEDGQDDDTSEEDTSDEEEEEDDEDLGEVITEDDLKDLTGKQIRPRTPTKEERRNYAFEKLRKENKERREKEEELDRIARTYGYTDHEAMIKALKEDALAKEAAKKGVDPELYKEVHESKKELERIKREREQERRAMQINAFVEKLDSFITSNNLTEDDKQDLLMALEDDGYTLDDIIRIKNPVNLFKGYSVDKIKERARQEEIARQERKRKASEKKFQTGNAGEDEVDLDAMLRSYFANKN